MEKKYTGIQKNGKNIQNLPSEQLDKIERYLASTDKEMRKIGQRMCHYYRINYYIKSKCDIVVKTTKPPYNYKVVGRTSEYSLNKLQEEYVTQIEILYVGWLIVSNKEGDEEDKSLVNVYEIKLNK